MSQCDRLCKPTLAIQESFGRAAAAGCSFSVVDHLRWDLRAIFRLAAQDRLLPSNPAEMLFTPPTVATPSRRVLTPEQVQQILQVLPVREQLIVRLALFSGMRPGEIFLCSGSISPTITSRSCIGSTAASSIGPRANGRNEPSPYR